VKTFLNVWQHADSFEAKMPGFDLALGIARIKAFSALRRRREAQLDGDYGAAIVDRAIMAETLLGSGIAARSCASA